MNEGYNEEKLEAALTEANSFAEAVAALETTAESVAAEVAETAAEAAETAAEVTDIAEVVAAKAEESAEAEAAETAAEVTDIAEVVAAGSADAATETAEPEAANTEVPKAPAKKKYKINYVRMGIFLICFCVAIFSAIKLIGILREYKKGTDTYNEVEEAAFKPPAHTEPESEDDKSIIPEIDFAALKRISSNAVAWLYNPGTVLNYPVAKTTDNNYYISHMIDGSYNANGCLFVDYRNADNFQDPNTIIYGHRMKNGTMLSNIASYNKQEYYDSHPVMYLLTPEGRYELQIFSAYITEATSGAYKRTFSSDKEFTEFVNNAVRHSYIKTDVKVQPGDHIVTLSTCVKSEDTRRFIALGKLVKIED